MPPEKQCRAMVDGQTVLGAYWSPPHRCLNYAVAGGYCHRHRPPDDDDERTRATGESEPADPSRS